MSVDYARAKALFLRALEQREADRDDWLNEACAGESELLLEVRALLDEAADAPTEAGLLDIPRDASPKIPGYRIARALARGGMGQVWLAEREGGEFRQQVAIKLMAAEALRDPLAVARFRAERQILASLDHPNIARLLDGGSVGEGWPYLVMEYVEGERIDQWCGARRLDARAIVALMIRVAQALQAAHRQLVVHRDLKPGNVLVDAHGEPKLLDFGIAKLLDGGALEVSRADTRTGAQLLTPRYAAPEQVRGEPVSTATDVYAFGVLLYELLSGESPYGEQAVTAHRLPSAVCEDEPPPPSVRLAQRTQRLHAQGSDDAPSLSVDSRQLRGDLDAIVLKCLRKRPDDRYAGMDSLVADLEAWRQGDPVAARRGSRMYRVRRYVRRHWFGLTVTLGIVLLTAGFVVQLSQQLEQTRIERDRAANERDKSEQVSQFLIDLMMNADPGKAMGEDISMREALDRGADELQHRFHDHPLLKSQLLETLSGIYVELGDYERGEQLADQALSLLPTMADVEESAWLQALNAQAVAVNSSGKQAERARELLRALADRAQADGDESLELNTLNALAGNLVNAEAFDDAERIQQQIQRRVLGRLRLANRSAAIERAGHPGVASEEGEDLRLLAMNSHNQCRLQILLGHLDVATEDCHAADSLKRALWPETHPIQLTTQIQLANLADLRGDIDGSIEAERKIVDLRRHIYGNDDYRTAFAMVNLATSLKSKSDYEKAEPLFLDALRILKAKLGEEHRAYLVTLNNYANMLGGKGDWQRALDMHTQVLALRRKTLGEKHSDVGSSLMNLANAQKALGRYADAVATSSQAVELLRDVLGESNPITFEASVSLAQKHLTNGDPAAADRIATHVLDVLDRGSDLPQIRGMAEFVRARALWRLGDREAFRRHAESALAVATASASSKLDPDEIEGWLRDPESSNSNELEEERVRATVH